MKHTCDHSICLVDQLSESLFLINGWQYHLMLSLLSNIFDRRCVDVLPRSHRTDLYSPIGYAFCGYKLLIKLCGGLALLHYLDVRLLSSQTTNHIKVFSLYDMILLWLEKLFLGLLLGIHFLLQVKRRCILAWAHHGAILAGFPGLCYLSRISTIDKSRTTLFQFFRFQSDNRALLVLLIVLI